MYIDNGLFIMRGINSNEKNVRMEFINVSNELNTKLTED